MRTTITPLALLLTCLPLAGLGCGNQGSGSSGGTVAESTQATASAAATTPPPTVSAAASAAAEPAPSAAPVDTAAAVASASAAAPATSAAAAPAATTAAATPSAAPSASAAAGEKKFDCGAKGQKPCPMQGWMKSVMGSAASSGDGEKLAKALAYTAGKSPPGMGQWAAISNEGVAKAKAGDIEGAKASCKRCHDLYKETYKRTMRDRPW